MLSTPKTQAAIVASANAITVNRRCPCSFIVQSGVLRSQAYAHARIDLSVIFPCTFNARTESSHRRNLLLPNRLEFFPGPCPARNMLFHNSLGCIQVSEFIAEGDP